MRIDGGRFLVTGGAGLIGSHVVDLLVDKEAAEVVVVDNFARGRMENLEGAMASGSVRVERADIRYPYEVAPLLEGIDGVFHLAAIRITRCAAYPRECLDTLVGGTFNVIEASLKAGVGKMVFSSTASVYGMADRFPTPEEHHAWNNDTLYGVAKVAGEGMFSAFKAMHGLEYVILRYFNVYGPRMDVFGRYTEVLIRWLEALDKGHRPKIFGDGKQTMDFVNVRDCARANLVAMESDVSGEAFNVGRGIEVSLCDLLDSLLRATGKTGVEPEHLPERTVNPVVRRLADVSKAKRLLEFEAEIGLEEGLRDLVRWRQQVLARAQEAGVRT